MRHNRNTKLRRKQQHAEYLIHPGKPTRIELKSVDSFSLEKLLEHDSVVDVFACRNPDTMRLEGSSDLGMTQDIIRRGRLFDEEEVVLGELGHVFDCFIDVPELIDIGLQIS